jgi:hypothetical protein
VRDLVDAERWPSPWTTTMRPKQFASSPITTLSGLAVKWSRRRADVARAIDLMTHTIEVRGRCGQHWISVVIGFPSNDDRTFDANRLHTNMVSFEPGPAGFQEFHAGG